MFYSSVIDFYTVTSSCNDFALSDSEIKLTTVLIKVCSADNLKLNTPFLISGLSLSSSNLCENLI